MRYKPRFALFFAAVILFNLAANFAHPVPPTIIKDLQGNCLILFPDSIL